MYAFSSKSGSEPFRALGDLTWNDPIPCLLRDIHFTRYFLMIGVARGAPKSCQRIFKNLYMEKNFKSERKNENVVILLFDYVLDFSAPHHLTKLVTIFLYI